MNQQIGHLSATSLLVNHQAAHSARGAADSAAADAAPREACLRRMLAALCAFGPVPAANTGPAKMASELVSLQLVPAEMESELWHLPSPAQSLPLPPPLDPARAALAAVLAAQHPTGRTRVWWTSNPRRSIDANPSRVVLCASVSCLGGGAGSVLRVLSRGRRTTWDLGLVCVGCSVVSWVVIVSHTKHTFLRHAALR